MWTECRMLLSPPGHMHVEESICGTRSKALPQSAFCFRMKLATYFSALNDSPIHRKLAVFLLVAVVHSLDGDRVIHTNVMVVRLKNGRRSSMYHMNHDLSLN